MLAALSHLAFFGYAAVKACLAGADGSLAAAFLLLCAAALAARARLLWARCADARAAPHVDAPPAPRPPAVAAAAADADARDALKRIRGGAAAELCAESGSRCRRLLRLLSLQPRLLLRPRLHPSSPPPAAPLPPGTLSGWPSPKI